VKMATTNGPTATQAPNIPTDGTDSTDRRNQVMVGDLPSDFLRTGPPLTQEQEDERIARILQAQQQAGVNVISAANFAGRLSISVVQAKLTKNYGLTKMDPYCRVRIGHTVFETPTAYNGAKAPRWNKTVSTYLPVGVDSLYLEVFDERSFTMDDRIAWAHIRIPDGVMSGETADEWFPLSGRQGDDKEGTINLVLSLTASAENNVYSYTYTTPVPVMMPMYYPPQTQPMVPAGQMPVYPPQSPHGPMYTEEDLKQVKDMFPNMEDEVIKSVMDANGGNKDATINSLLAMGSE
jgi:toll-interacting protein